MYKKTAIKLCVLVTFTLASFTTTVYGQGVSGTIVETSNGGGYTYILVDSGVGQDWVAIPETPVKAGDTVTYSQGMEMKDFHSKTLNKTFPSIIFSPGLESGGAVQLASMSAGADDSFEAAVQKERQTTSPEASQTPAEPSGGSTGAIVPMVKVEVVKAQGENGYTVGEIYTKASELSGKKVKINAKVVKFNPNIMGRNWVHVQDGTGNPMQNSHDLVITTGDTVALGEVVTFEGVLTANKDFGAGYSYAVIVEEAKVVQ